jgi:hypothetical protein
MMGNRAAIAADRAEAQSDSATAARERRRSEVLLDLAGRIDAGQPG